MGRQSGVGAAHIILSRSYVVRRVSHVHFRKSGWFTLLTSSPSSMQRFGIVLWPVYGWATPVVEVRHFNLHRGELARAHTCSCHDNRIEPVYAEPF